MDPLVTIVITSYNYGEYVGDAIQSALAQTYGNVEVLIMDNASTDNSMDVIRSFHDERIRVILQPENVGIQRNHNEGIRRARGEYVVLLAADDMLLPTLVEDVLSYRRTHPDVDIVYASVAIVDKNRKILENFDHPSFDGALAYVGRNEFAMLLTRDSCMYLPTVLFPKTIFDELGLLDESLTIVLDYEFDIRMAAAGKKFAFLSKPEALIRFHGENRSGVKNFVKTGSQLREFCTILERYSQPKYYDRIAGYGPQLLAMVQNKINEFQVPFPAEFATQRNELEPYVARATRAVSAVPALSSAVLAGQPLISAVVPFAGLFGPLQRALESLAKQSYERWEAVVVCDGAPDPDGLIGGLGLSERVKVARTGRTAAGPAGARNLGLGCTSGEVIAYLDADNRFEPEYFRDLAVAFSAPSIAATAGTTKLSIVEANGDALLTLTTDFGLSTDGTVSAVSNRLPLNAVAHRRYCVTPQFRFHPVLSVLEDWEFLIRLSRQFPIVPLGKPALEMCVNVGGQGHHLLSRKTSAQWNEFAQSVQNIYNGYPPRSKEESEARTAYAASLQPVIQRGVNSFGRANDVAAFVTALAGPASFAPAIAAQ